MLKQTINILLNTKIYIASIASLMCIGTCLILNLTIYYNVIFLIFFSTLFVYNLYWLLGIKKKLQQISQEWTIKNIFITKIFMSIGFLGSVFFLFTQLSYLYLGIPVAILTVYYILQQNTLNIKFKIPKTFILSFVWTYITVLFIAIPQYPCFALVEIISLFIIQNTLIYIICLLFDYRDQEIDMPYYNHNITPYNLQKKSFILIASVLIIIILCTFTIYVKVIYLFIFALLLLLVYKKNKSNNNLFYYFFLDGLMALPTICIILIKILSKT